MEFIKRVNMNKATLILIMLMHSLIYSCQSSPKEIFTSTVAIEDTTLSAKVNGQISENDLVLSDTAYTNLVEQLSDVAIFGNWEVVRFVGGAFAEISEAEAKTFVGKRIKLNSEAASFLREFCKSPQYRTRIADAEEHFYYQFRTYPKTLGITSKEVKIIDIYCSLGEEASLEEEYPEFSLEIFNENTLIYFTQGYFFYLNRVGES